MPFSGPTIPAEPGDAADLIPAGIHLDNDRRVNSGACRDLASTPRQKLPDTSPDHLTRCSPSRGARHVPGIGLKYEISPLISLRSTVTRR